MPFGTIVANTVSYEPRQPGIYQKAGLSFNSPSDEFRLRPAIAAGKDGKLRASISRVFEKDVTLTSGAIVRDQLIVTINVTTSAQFTPAEIDTRVSDISEFISSSTLNRLLTGEA